MKRLFESHPGQQKDPSPSKTRRGQSVVLTDAVDVATYWIVIGEAAQASVLAALPQPPSATLPGP